MLCHLGDGVYSLVGEEISRDKNWLALEALKSYSGSTSSMKREFLKTGVC